MMTALGEGVERRTNGWGVGVREHSRWMDVGGKKRPEGLQEVRKGSVFGLRDEIKVGSEARAGEG